ncbi:hypothetical protein ACSSVQ_001171 [Parvibaculum sp. MBR-TMA-1.3b-4.2]
MRRSMTAIASVCIIRTMPNLKEQTQAIIEELNRLQTAPPPYREDDEDFPLPRLIGTGDGNSILVSRKIDVAIAAIADQLRSEIPDITQKTTREEWRWQVRREFGPALAKIDLAQNLGSNADSVISMVKNGLRKNVAAYGEREIIFGCTLFYNKSLPPFQIGPVCFEPRSAWLNRQHQEGYISSIGCRRLEKKWSGETIRRRKPSSDSLLETDILETIGKCPYVCSVRTSGLSAEAGREKALTVARLAVTSIALLWRSPTKTLDGMNLLPDRPWHRETILISAPNQRILASSKLSHMPHGPTLENGQWEHLFAEHKAHFDAAGKILFYLVKPYEDTDQPRLKNTLAQALLWFHEGCRETVTLMAIVKYSAALDALACGGGEQGIRRMINARLGIHDEMPICPGGPTLQKAVEEIYKYGRSRTIHGTNKKLGHDWIATRETAEQFARMCLLACLDWMASHPKSDDPKLLSL